MLNSKGWLEFIGDRGVSDRTDAENYIQRILDSRNSYYSVFELIDSAKPIGVVTLLKRDDEEYPDIGFAMLPEFERQGYALEASSAYLDKVTEHGQYENIIAFTKTDNPKSINLLLKLGLQYDGDYRKGEEVLSYYRLDVKK